MVFGALRSRLGGFGHPEKLRNMLPNVAIWGGAAGVIALTLLEPIPQIRAAFLQHIPIAGKYWEMRVKEREQVD